MTPVNLAAKMAQVSACRDPHVVAECNDNEGMVVRCRGGFPCHLSEMAGDFFPVLQDEMVIDLEHASHVVQAGSPFVVPKGEASTGDPATATTKPRI